MSSKPQRGSIMLLTLLKYRAAHFIVFTKLFLWQTVISSLTACATHLPMLLVSRLLSHLVAPPKPTLHGFHSLTDLLLLHHQVLCFPR
ncbi:hypothetical protein B0J14DRAFT_572197 [Halenospora varia]|nr:hypothetical protein B0J14DRAFT_572197 [Halenospora varia]